MKKFIVFFTVVIAVSIAGCYYDNMEDVYPGNDLFRPCDTTTATSYSQHIRQILDNNCVSCHTGAGGSGGVQLDNYSGVQTVASSGLLVGVTWHEPGYTPMPPTGNQLDSCSLVQIKKWVLAGAPNN